MIARLLISANLEKRVGEINKILRDHGLTNPHPDLLYLPHDSKLGIEQARQIKNHFFLKPYSAKGKVVVLEDASALTLEAQNALLKTLEEPPREALLILGASSDAKLLPTILSRCQIIRKETNLVGYTHATYEVEVYMKDLKRLLNSDMQQRFEYIEKLKDREEFLHAMVRYFHQELRIHPRGVQLDFLKDLLQAEKWADQNVNIRAILEYLMLVMPQKL